MAIEVVVGGEVAQVTQGGGAAAGDRYPSWVTGTVTAVSGQRTNSSGSWFLRFAAAATQPDHQYNFRTTVACGYARVYFKFSANPSATATIMELGTAAGTQPSLKINTNGTLAFNIGGGAATTSALSVDTWYGVEMMVNATANPHTGKWRLWTAGGGWVLQTAPTNYAAAATVHESLIIELHGPTSACTVDFDDCVAGGAASEVDWQSSVWEDKGVVCLRPNADGTHSFTAGDFGYDAAGADVATNATGVYAYLDDTTGATLTEFIRQKVVRSTGYLELLFEDTPSSTAPLALTVLINGHSPGTGGNADPTIKFSDDSFTSTVTYVIPGGFPSAAWESRWTTLATKPSTGAWDAAALTGFKARIGHATDITPVPYWDNVLLEVWLVAAASATAGWSLGLGFP